MRGSALVAPTGPRRSVEPRQLNVEAAARLAASYAATPRPLAQAMVVARTRAMIGRRFGMSEWVDESRETWTPCGAGASTGVRHGAGHQACCPARVHARHRTLSRGAYPHPPLQSRA